MNNEKEKQKRTKRLIQLMDKYELSAQDVATIIGHHTAQTVRVWRSWDARPIPQAELELLELKVATFAAGRKSADRASA